MSDDQIDRAQVHAIVDEFADPETGRGLGVMGQVKEVDVSGSSIRVDIGLTTHSAALWPETRMALRDRLREKLPGVTEVAVDIVEHIRPPEPLGAIGLTAK